MIWYWFAGWFAALHLRVPGEGAVRYRPRPTGLPDATGAARCAPFAMHRTVPLMHQLALFPAADSGGRVYYATDGWRIKIGYTTRAPKRRGGELTAAILYAEPGDRDLEAARHRQWRGYRIGGSEWFEAGDDLMLWLVVRMTGEGHTAALQAMRGLILAHKSRQPVVSAA